jgi:hypothetical protein
MDAVAEFRGAMAAQGLEPDEIVADGSIHRFKVARDDHKRNGWFSLHVNGTGPAWGVAAIGRRAINQS